MESLVLYICIQHCTAIRYNLVFILYECIPEKSIIYIDRKKILHQEEKHTHFFFSSLSIKIN